MKVIQIEKYGTKEVMKVKELPMPVPKDDEILVKIAVAGVNFIDIYQRSGLYQNQLPYNLGLEGAGIVEAIGPEVTGFKAGDKVAWCHVAGSYATHVLARAHSLVQIPPELDFKEAAAAMLQGLTAHYLTHDTYKVMPGDKCLVHAAAGGVGLLLCQILKILGAYVIGTVSTAEKAEMAKKAGADEIILYTQTDIEEEVKRITSNKGVNVVYDSVGKDTFEKSLNCLSPRGYLVLFGQSSGPVAPFDPQLLNKKGSLFLTRPSLAYYIASREEFQKRAQDIFDWIITGKLKLKIDHVYPLDQVHLAHQDLNSRKTTGKLLLLP